MNNSNTHLSYNSVSSRNFSTELTISLDKAKHQGFSHLDAVLKILGRVKGMAGVMGAITEQEGLILSDIKETAWQMREELEYSILIIDEYLDRQKAG